MKKLTAGGSSCEIEANELWKWVLMSLGLESKNNLPFNFVPHKI